MSDKALAERSTEELQQAFLLLVSGLGEQAVAEALMLMAELERRARIVSVVNTLTAPNR